MRILLHVCCAPCAVYPISILKGDLFEIVGYFDNPNIHPYKEFEKRQSSVRMLSKDENIQVYFSASYDLEYFLEETIRHKSQRCLICYAIRLKRTAAFAASNNFDCFTTTLLYSKYQNHEAIINTAKMVAEKTGIEFFYKDFRIGWKAGIAISKERGYYRQQYCGCIFSEKERYLTPKKHL